MGQCVGSFRDADHLDGAKRIDCNPEPTRVGEADVFRGENHETPSDELGILPCSDHGVKPVERRIDVGPPDALDECRNHVVVAIASLVVADHPPLERFCDFFATDRIPSATLSDRHRQFEAVQSQAGVAANAMCEILQRVVVDRNVGDAPNRIGHGPTG